MRIAMGIEYDGTAYNGWQKQNVGTGIQSVVEDAVSEVADKKIDVICAGRTDSGVHANEQSAHFDCKNKISQTIRFLKSINHFLRKEGISILKVKKKNDNFHARFSARIRIYKYIIINRLSAPVIEKNRSWHVIKKLDLELMRKGAKKLIGTKDFSTFRSSSCRAKSPIRTMKLVTIKSSKNKIEIEFRSQSFLQQQVRSMVGCLKYLGEKKWSLKKFENIIKLKKRGLCAPPAPPEGLYLKRVIY